MSSTCNAWNNRHFWSNMHNEDSFFFLTFSLTIIREYAIPRIQTGSLLEILQWLFLHPEQNSSFCHGSCCLYYVSSSHSPGSSLGPTPSHPTPAHAALTAQLCFSCLQTPGSLPPLGTGGRYSPCLECLSSPLSTGTGTSLYLSA